MASFRRIESIRKLQDMRRESTGPLNFSHKLFLCCLGGGTMGLMCMFLIVALGLFALNIAKIVLGAIHLDACPAQPLIPIYLIVGGVFSLVMNCSCRPGKGENGEVKLHCQGAGMILGVLIGLFSLCWLITGTVLVVQTRTAVGSCNNISTMSGRTVSPGTTFPQTSATLTTFPSDNGTRSSTTSVTMTTKPNPEVESCPSCNDVLLSFAFGIVLVEWSFFVLLIMSICCVCCFVYRICLSKGSDA